MGKHGAAQGKWGPGGWFDGALADLAALPPHIKGEIIEGVLYTQPRPRAAHQGVVSLINSDLRSPYQRGRNGPGGWWILVEPGIELPGSPEFSPDLAGFRRERLPRLPEDEPIRTAPDWVCEILSPATRAFDLKTKKPFYARIGVSCLWYFDLDAQTLTVCRLHEGRWLELGVYADSDVVRAEPFDAVELCLAEWWQQVRIPSLPCAGWEHGKTRCCCGSPG
jgi:Uma2 family endonuclease